MNIGAKLSQWIISFAALVVVAGIHPAQAQSAVSDFCVSGSAPRKPHASAEKYYYKHNAIIMADYKQMANYYSHAKMRKLEGADTMIRRLEEAKAASPHLDRRMWGVIAEPPAFSDLSRSCERLSTTNIPFVAGEYPIVLNSHTPRLTGDMCAEEPVIRFDVVGGRLLGIKVDLEDFYDPAYSGEPLLRYAELERQADRNRRLPAFIRALMGVRMAQCGDLPASMTFMAGPADEPVMTASLLFLDHGIEILTRDDASARRIVAARTRKKEQLAARLGRSEDWEKRAAVGAALVFTGLAIMAMHRCNDSGVFGNTSLPDCE